VSSVCRQTLAVTCIGVYSVPTELLAIMVQFGQNSPTEAPSRGHRPVEGFGLAQWSGKIPGGPIVFSGVVRCSTSEAMGNSDKTVNLPHPGNGPASVVREPSWYAIRTRSRHEKMVVKQLESLHVETFLPLLSQVHRWSDRRKRVELPLFPGYAFVRLVCSPDQRIRVVRTHGVVGFVGTQSEAV